VRKGLLISRRLFMQGFGNDTKPDYPGTELFVAIQENELNKISDISIPNALVSETTDPSYWSILKELKGTILEDIAYDIVIKGGTTALTRVPICSFRNLKTVDRAEIESLRSIKNLIHEYVLSKSSIRPLSIAVFGAPGSGKSFGVTEVAESVAPGLIVRLNFNVSQFKSTSDLAAAFHRVRDIVLQGKIPLVFFDEFDTFFEIKLGWLKHFLEPMQDGTFRQGEFEHPIGKSIFVFAGGIYHTFDAFYQENQKESEKERIEFKNAKGPDFISRLRGYVNILGPNQLDSNDTVFMIRRALLLRSMLERKAKQLFDSNNHVRIDEGVLRALIKTSNYRHGARSIEAIIEMSMLHNRSCWEQAFLPPKEQLKLHVDEEMFSRLMIRDVLLGAAREILAKAIHKEFRKNQKGKKKATDPSMRPWKNLRENLKESNRLLADHIPQKLRKIGCGFMPVIGQRVKIFEFTKEEIEILAEMEHERWVLERLQDDWVYSKERDVEKKKSPYLVPWKDLSEDVKEWDREAMRNLPKLLSSVKFEIYRLH